MNCTKPGLSIICLYLLLSGFNRALVVLNNDSRYGQRGIRSKFCYGQSSSPPKLNICGLGRVVLKGAVWLVTFYSQVWKKPIGTSWSRASFKAEPWLVNCWVQSWTKNHSQWSQIKFGVVILKEAFNSLSPNIIIKFSWHVNTFRAFLVGKIR